MFGMEETWLPLGKSWKKDKFKNGKGMFSFSAYVFSVYGFIFMHALMLMILIFDLDIT